MKDTLVRRVRFAGFEFDLKTGELRGGGQTARLTEKPFRVLAILVEHGGELVTREEIQKRLWPSDTVVDFEHGINTAIKVLRRVLGDPADQPKYIETIPRRGYRLMVPVESDASSSSTPASEPLRNRAATAGLLGKKVSHYRVLEVIGGGGMGLVYKAEDLRLGRRVALKFLPEELASDAVALQRFEREAQTASSLNYPNICTIYAIEEHEGQPFIVMELLEGQTLRERLAASDGALPLEELLDIALQVRDGLQAAHERGIIHRDIKPANIFLTSKGVCKILDFGLAKLLEIGNEDELVARPDTPGVASPAASVLLTLTRAGAAMGTAGYMSPEQVRREKLDARTDLFSFGLVLYEMATGQRAFSGETAEVVHEAILHQPQIPVHDLNAQLPPELEIIINKALEKDREARYQTAADMTADLKQLKRGAGSAIQKPKRYVRILLLGLATLVLALLAVGGRLRWFTTQQTAPRKMLRERQLTHSPSEIRLLNAAISADGKHVAYIDTKGLHFSVIETGEIHDVPLPEELRTNLWEVTWFPDGEKLLLRAEPDAEGNTIWIASVFGGAPHKLRGDGRWPMASPLGTLIAFVSRNGHEIWVMGADGENPHKILTGENEVFAAPAWSPTGQRLAYIKKVGSETGGSIETVALDGGPPSLVISDPQLVQGETPGLVWARDGRMIFVLEGRQADNVANLWEIMTDPQTGSPSGSATQITDWDGVVFYSPTIDRDANRLAVVKLHIRNDVFVGVLEDSGRGLAAPTRVTVSESEDYPSGWMRDGKTILFSSNRTGRTQVFRQQIGRDAAELLIRGPDDEEGAELSPDGRWILYWSSERDRNKPSATKRLMRFPALGGSPELILEARADDGVGFDCPVRVTRPCVFSQWEQGQLIFYALDPVQGRGEAIARTKMGSPADFEWRVSPEGLRIVAASGDQLPHQLRILNLQNGTERDLSVRPWHVFSLSWAADGDAMFASVGYFIVRIELDGKLRVLLDRSRNQFLNYVRPSPDGRHLAFSQQTFESNAWLLENF